MHRLKCFTKEQWQIYYRAGSRKYCVCQDCSPDYQQEMKDAGWCEHPEVKFHWTGHRWVMNHNGPDQIDEKTIG